MKELYLCIVQRNTAVASSHTWPDRPTFPAAVSSHPCKGVCALVPHSEAPVAHSWQDWCTALAFLSLPVTHFGPTDPDLTLSRCPKLRISLPRLQNWPHAVAASQSCSCYFTHVKYWQFCFLAGALKLNLLFHCLNHWNEYTTQPKNSCLREAAVPTVTHYRDSGSGSSTAINCLLTHWTKLYFKKMCSAGQSRKPQVRMHFIPQRCIIKEGLQICVGTALTPY